MVSDFQKAIMQEEAEIEQAIMRDQQNARLCKGVMKEFTTSHEYCSFT